MATTTTHYRTTLILHGNMSQVFRQFPNQLAALRFGVEVVSPVWRNPEREAEMGFAIVPVSEPAPLQEWTPSELASEWRSLIDWMYSEEAYESYPGQFEALSMYGEELADEYTKQTGGYIVDASEKREV